MSSGRAAVHYKERVSAASSGSSADSRRLPAAHRIGLARQAYCTTNLKLTTTCSETSIPNLSRQCLSCLPGASSPSYTKQQALLSSRHGSPSTNIDLFSATWPPELQSSPLKQPLVCQDLKLSFPHYQLHDADGFDAAAGPYVSGPASGWLAGPWPRSG